jgi:hypothetical protein
MNMIFDATHLQRGHLMFARDASDVRPDAPLYISPDPGLSIFGAES